MREPSEGGIVLSSPNHLPPSYRFLSVVCSSLFVAKPFLLPLVFFPKTKKKETRRTHGLVLPAPSHYTLLLLYISRLSLHLLLVFMCAGRKELSLFFSLPLWISSLGDAV